MEHQFKPIYRGRGRSVWLPFDLHEELKEIARWADAQKNPKAAIRQLMAGMQAEGR